MASLQAVINPPVQEVRLGSSATFSCLVYDSTGHESTRPLSYEWEAAPYIVQEQRYTFSEDKHKLEIYDVKISDNNTAVWCRGGPSSKAKARILVVPSFPGNNGIFPPTTQAMTSDAMIAGPHERQGKNTAGATIASLLIILAVFAVLLVFAYRKLRNSRRSTNLGIGSSLLGNKFGHRKSKITRYSGGEEGTYQEPVIPAFNNPPQYTCLTHTNPINKRPIPPPRTKRGRRNTEPAPLGAIAEEVDGYNIIRPCSAEPPKATGEHSGYMDMSGKSKKGQNRTLRRAYSQYDADDDYENINIRTISNRPANQTYVNQNMADKSKGHLPSHSSGHSNGSKPPRGGKKGGTLVYASLDLGEVQGGQVFTPPPEGERTTYAKILRILSVFRTMRSTRIRVVHTGADGRHARGQCDTTRYR